MRNLIFIWLFFLLWGNFVFGQIKDAILIVPSVEVDASQLNRTGRFNLKFSFNVLEETKDPYQIRVAIYAGNELLFRRDHNAPSPTTKWKKNQTITYDLPSLFPLNSTRPLTNQLDVYVGFYEPKKKKKILPIADSFVKDNQVSVATFEAPKELSESYSEEELEKIDQELKELKKTKSLRESFDLLEMCIRKTSSYSQKKEFRRKIEKLGSFEPREVNAEEKKIIGKRIWDEKVRYMRLRAGKLFDQKQYRAAYGILKDIGGKIEEEGQEAVIGAVDEAKRNERDLEGIRKKIFGEISPEDLDLYKKLVNADNTLHKKKLLIVAKNALKKDKKLLAWNLLRKVKNSHDEETQKEGEKLLEDLENYIIGDLTEEEKKGVEAAKNPAAWSRLHYKPTHKFIFIGPKIQIEGLVANKKSTLRFDLAYIFLTDLFHFMPNRGGDRITVFYKELWDFGGGVGGGKIIDIGKADPKRKVTRVDNGLLYHELTHCIARITPGYFGFNEGIANFGAAFCFNMLSQDGDQHHSFNSNLKAFHEDFVNRDLEFWRIQKYGPSAGFFLHFIEKYGKRGKEFDWNLYRQFFRDYRYTLPKDGRTRTAIRGIAFLFMKYFGDEALDDLIRFRFPLEKSDREVLKQEFAKDSKVASLNLRKFPNTPKIRDRGYAHLKQISNSGESEKIKSFAQSQLGIIYDFMICGPFISTQGGSHQFIFPPESEIDFKKTYPSDKHTGIWREPHVEKGYVIQKPNGWISLEFPYPDNTAYYAYTQVMAPEETDALLHIRADDYFKIFVNDKLVNIMKDQGTNGSDYVHYRNRWAHVPDQMFFPIHLSKGKNKILLKITNGSGPCGFVAAISAVNQGPLKGLTYTTEPPSNTSIQKGTTKWKKTSLFSFSKKNSYRALDRKVGKFAIKQKLLVGLSKDKGVAWRKYTVRPGFPKDSPSNLFWLPKKLTQKGEDFYLSTQLISEDIPKFTITFDGEGKKDGLSGWTLIFHKSKKGLKVNIEKYDHLYYESKIFELKKTTEYHVILEYSQEKLTLQVNEAILFNKLPLLPITLKDSHRIGFCLWGPKVGIKSILIKK